MLGRLPLGPSAGSGRGSDSWDATYMRLRAVLVSCVVVVVVVAVGVVVCVVVVVGHIC